MFLKSEFRDVNFNPNSNMIAYANHNTLRQLDSYPFGYFLVDNKALIALAIRNDIEENCIIVSQAIYEQIGDPLNVNLKPFQFPLYNYSIKNKYNYLPKIPIAKKISISIIYNKNASLIGLLKLMKPFVGMKEQRFSVDLNDQSIIRELPNRLTKNKDQMIHFQIRSEDQLNDYQIYDLRVAVIEQKELIYDYLPKQYSEETFHSIIYNQGEFSQFKLTLTKILLSKQSSSILLETNKNYGKRQLFRELAGLYGFNYHEKDVQTLTSINHIKLFLSKSIVTHSLLFLRNISSLVQILQQSKSKSTKEDFESAIVKLLKYIKKSSTHQIILIIDMLSIQDYSLLKCYFDIQISFKPNNDQTIVDIFSDYYNRQLDQSLIKLIPWRQIEKIIDNKDLEKLLQQKNKCIAQLIQEQSIQSSTRQEDVGGMDAVIKEISKTILMPQLYPEIFDEQVKPRRGILFFGPPGTGKTLLAKCISTELKMNFISVKGPEMLNMYIGESESNIRKLFQKARENSPCLIFFDELDSLAPARGNRGDSNQVMDRIVAQLLTEIDSLQQGVFIIGATNRPDLLDPSLLRPGRFDKLQYLGIKTDRESRISILRAQTKSNDFDDIVDQLPPNFTGADFYGLTSQATVCATKRAIEQIQAGHEAEVKLQIEDFQEALKSLKPSVTLAELEKYEELRVKYSQN